MSGFVNGKYLMGAEYHDALRVKLHKALEEFQEICSDEENTPAERWDRVEMDVGVTLERIMADLPPEGARLRKEYFVGFTEDQFRLMELYFSVEFG